MRRTKIRKFAHREQTKNKQTDRQTKKQKTANILASFAGSASINYCILLARSPDDPQRIRVASVFEFFFVLCLFSVGKFSNFSSPHPPLL